MINDDDEEGVCNGVRSGDDEDLGAK